MKINKLLYDFLQDKVGDYQLRYPFQDSPIDSKKGFVTWQHVNSQILSTQKKFNEFVGNRIINQYIQKFQSQYMLIVERENSLNNTQPFELISNLNIYLNSDLFINFCKQNYNDCEVLRINESIACESYYSEAKKWNTRANMTLNFIENRIVTLNDLEVHNISIQPKGV